MSNLPSPMGQAALQYARAGWPVFPCRECDSEPYLDRKTKEMRVAYAKSPYTGSGWKNATTDEQTIVGWWKRNPRALIGIPMDKNGLFAIDFDPRVEQDVDAETGEVTERHYTLEQLKADTEAMMGCELPSSLVALTPSGGVHLYLRQPSDGGEPVRNRGNLPAHVDVRGRGGYLIAPPSKIVEPCEQATAGDYRWIRGRYDDATAAVDAPAALIELLRAPKAGPAKNAAGDQPAPSSSLASTRANGPDTSDVGILRKYGLSALDKEIDVLAAVREGQGRNIQINTSAFRMGQLVGAGALSETFVRSALQAVIDQMPNNGDPAGAARTLDSGLIAGMGKPRDLSDVLAAARSRPRRAPGPPESSQGKPSSQMGESRPESGGSGGPGEDEADLDGICAAYQLTDFGNAERFLRRHGHRFLYVPEWGWLAWDGRRWNRERAEPMVARAVHETVRAIQQEAARVAASGCRKPEAWVAPVKNADEEDEEEEEGQKPKAPLEQRLQYKLWSQDGRREGGLDYVYEIIKGRVKLYSTALAEWGRTSESSSRLSCIAGIAQPYLAARPAEFDADPMKINLANGTMLLGTIPDTNTPGYRFKEGVFDPMDKITKLARFSFDEKAKAPVYHKFLNRVQPAEDMRHYLHVWGGYNMTGDTSAQKMSLFYGEGANGKSTWVDVVAYGLGDYSKTVGIETFIDQGRHRKGGDATPDLAALSGVRMIRTSEPEQGAKFSDGLIKAMTGSEPMSVRELNKGFFEMQMTGKVTCSANIKPMIGTDHGIRRRVRLIPWGVIIPEEERDDTLSEQLKKEIDGIFLCLVDGVLEWMRDGLPEPQAIKDATREYQEENDPVGRFVDLCVQPAKGERVQSSALYDVFRAWQIASGELPPSGKAWSQKYLGGQLKKKGYKSLQSNTVFWLDIQTVKQVSDFVDENWRPVIVDGSGTSPPAHGHDPGSAFDDLVPL